MFVLLTADSIISSGLQLGLFVSTASLAWQISPTQLGPQPTRHQNANVPNIKENMHFYMLTVCRAGTYIDTHVFERDLLKRSK